MKLEPPELGGHVAKSIIEKENSYVYGIIMFKDQALGFLFRLMRTTGSILFLKLANFSNYLFRHKE